MRTDMTWQMNPANQKQACSSRQNNQTADVHWTFRMTVWFQCQPHFFLGYFIRHTEIVWSDSDRIGMWEHLLTCWWLMANMEKKSHVLVWRSNGGCLGLIFISMLRTTHTRLHYKKRSAWLSFEPIIAKKCSVSHYKSVCQAIKLILSSPESFSVFAD